MNLVFGAINCVVMLALLFTDVYAAFAALFPREVYLQVIAVVVLDLAVSTVTGIVKSYIATMIIEQKYGFNRSSIKTFISTVSARRF